MLGLRSQVVRWVLILVCDGKTLPRSIVRPTVAAVRSIFSGDALTQDLVWQCPATYDKP